jgi:phosphoserine aminotransferase
VGDAVDVTRACSGATTTSPAPRPTTSRPSAARTLHITSNNTLEGTQYHTFRRGPGAPLVADMSSRLPLAPARGVAATGCVYAGAQKNLGPSGLVVVVARRALLAQARTDIPKIFRFGVHDANGSLYNTPNTFGVYMLRHVLAWIEEEGGLAAIARRNEAKAAAVYAALDGAAGFYTVPARSGSRSAMNVVYRLPDAALETRYLEGAAALGMVGLQGHRSVGGLRASLYNAVSEADAEALAGYTRDFARRWG